jgi:hypothetical protein
VIQGQRQDVQFVIVVAPNRDISEARKSSTEAQPFST